MIPNKRSGQWPCGPESSHGADGSSYIAEQIGRIALEGDEGGMAMWKKVAACYSELVQQVPPPNRL